MALAIWGQGDSALEQGGSFETWGRILGGGGDGILSWEGEHPV